MTKAIENKMRELAETLEGNKYPEYPVVVKEDFIKGFRACYELLMPEAEKLEQVLIKHKRMKAFRTGELITENIIHELYDTQDTKEALESWEKFKGEK